MTYSESNLHDQCDYPTAFDIRKKIIELNSIDLLDEFQNQSFFDDFYSFVDKLCVSYRENDKNIENIEDIIEEIFSIVFLLCENQNPQVFQLIDPLFMLKSISKTILFQFCTFLNHLKKNFPDIQFNDRVKGFINSTKEILISTLKQKANNEFIDLHTNSTLYLSYDDSSKILATLLFLTESNTGKQDVLSIYRLMTDTFIHEKKLQPFFVDFLSNCIKVGVIDEIGSFFHPELFENLSNDTLLFLFENYNLISLNLYSILYKYAKNSKYQPLCNAVANSHVQLIKNSKAKNDKNIIKILLNCDAYQFNLEFWDDLGNNETVNLPEPMIERISLKYYECLAKGEITEKIPPLPVLICKLVSDPRSVITQEQAADILRHSNDFVAINSLLTMNFNDDILTDPSFWVNYGSHYEGERLSINAIECFWFRYQQKQIKLADILFYNNCQPNHNMCQFINAVLKEHGYNSINDEQDLNDSVHKNVNGPLFPEFWCIFRGEKLVNLYNNAPEEKKFYFYYGLCCTSKISTSPVDVIHFCKLSKSSYEYLYSIIDGTTVIDYFLPLPNDIQCDLLYFISSTLMCANIFKSNLIKAITFSNGSDFFLFTALFIQITSNKPCEFKIFQGNCLFDAYMNARNFIKDESGIKNINILISLILKISFIKMEETINNFFGILSGIVDCLWTQYKDSEICTIFPNFDEFAYLLYSFYVEKENYLFCDLREGFPSMIDYDMIQMFFEKYKSKTNTGSNMRYTGKNRIDVCDMLKNPTPELFGFLSEYLNVDYSDISSDEFDENLIISSFFKHFKIDPEKNKAINKIISNLSDSQIISIINELIDFVSFDPLIQIIEKNMTIDDQKKILTIEPYLQFIRKEVYKTLHFVLQLDSQHELANVIIQYIKSHQDINLNINPNDPNFLNKEDLNKIPVLYLFEIDNILNSSFELPMERINEAIHLLFSYTIRRICKHEEISNEIKSNLFLSSYEENTNNENNNNNEVEYSLIPTFESFSNLRNVVKFIFDEFLLFRREKEIFNFLTLDQSQSLRSILPLFHFKKIRGLGYQAYFIIRACPSFKKKSFPLTHLLKMYLIKNLFNIKFKESQQDLYNATHLRFCSGSTGTLFYVTLLRSLSNNLKISKDLLLRHLNQYVINTPDSFLCLKNALTRLFVRTKDDHLFYLDIDNSLFKKPSRQSILLVRHYLLKGPFTQTYLAFLLSFFLAYPDLTALVFDDTECQFEENINHAESHDVIWFIKKLIPLIKNTTKYHIFEDEFDVTQTIVIMLLVLLKNPQLGDKIIQFMFENILNYGIDVLIAFLYVIRIACSFSSMQSIITGYLIRYNFIEIAHQIIPKLKSYYLRDTIKFVLTENYDSEKQQFEILTDDSEIATENNSKSEKADFDMVTDTDSSDFDENDFAQRVKHFENHDQRTTLTEPYIKQEEAMQSIMILITLLVRYEENEMNNSSEVISMISKRQNPFKEFNTQQSYYSNDQDSQTTISPSPLRVDTHLLYGEQLRSLMFIPFTISKQNYIVQLINEIETVEYNFRPPPDVSLEYFQELPDENACQLIIDRIPRINERITAEGYELLFKYPPWVMNWVIQRPQTILLQQHYDIIYDCINQINMMNSSRQNPLRSITLVSKQTLNIDKNNSLLDNKNKFEMKEQILDYKRICEFICLAGIYQSPDYYKLLHTVSLYIYSHKSLNENKLETDDLNQLKSPKEFLIYYAKKMYLETTSATSFCSMIYCFYQFADSLANTIADIACTCRWRNIPDILYTILNFYKEKIFFKESKKNNSNANINNRLLPFNQNPRNFQITFSNSDILSIQYLLNQHNNIFSNNINITQNENENDDNENNNNDNNNKNDAVVDDFSDVDEMYRYDFFVILSMSESPKVLASMMNFAPRRLINAALSRGSCVSNAFLRCLRSSDVQKYSTFFNALQSYKGFCAKHEPQIIERIRDLLPNWEGRTSQIITLFSLLSYQTIDDPKKVCEEYYEQLSPFWQLVYDSRTFISRALLDQNSLIDTSFVFMKPVVHTLSFDFRVKYLKTFMREILTSKTRAIIVRRSHILEDSFKIIMNMSPNEFLSHISVTFDGERGIDAGGLLRDWFTNLTKALFNENYALFVSSNHGTFLPNPNSSVNENHLKYFEFAGRIFSRALVEQIHLEPHLALALRKKLLNCELALDDIEEFDPDLHTSLKWILENELSANPDFEMFFTADKENIGKHEVQDLIENGSKILVNDENKQMFVQKTIEFRTDTAIKQQCSAFCAGFFSIIPRDKIGIFSPEELDRIICGESFIDVDDWQRNCHFAGQFSISHPTIVTFFKVIKKWEQKDIAKLLAFITGSTQVPLGGFAAYKEFGKPITIGSVDGRDKLITAHTCSNLLDLPNYETDDELDSKIRLAIQECNTFDFH